jgi:hypothetical protein
VQCGGQTVAVRMSAFSRHVSIMRLLPLGYEPTDVRLRCLLGSLVTTLTSADLRYEVVPGLPHLSRLSLSRCARFTNRFTEPVLNLWLLRFHGRGHARSSLSVGILPYISHADSVMSCGCALPLPVPGSDSLIKRRARPGMKRSEVSRSSTNVRQPS